MGPQDAAGALGAEKLPLDDPPLLRLLNAEKAFWALSLPQPGHSGVTLANRDLTNFSNLLPQSWQTYS